MNANGAALEVVIDRAVALAKDAGFTVNRPALFFDVLIANRECNLDLPALAAADDVDLAHDVFGIQRHMQPDGTLGDCFWPRYARGI